MNKILVSIFVIGLLTTCNQQPNNVQTEAIEIGLKYDTSKIAIISWDSARYQFDDRGFKQGELTQKDLDTVDSLVLVCVTTYNQEMNLPPEHKEYEIDLTGRDYKRQLVAVINTKGEKEVWANFFCNDRNKSWQTNILAVRDGGPCYFNLMINLTNKTFYDLMVNGLA
jgi:hypothetical protein